MRVSLLMNAVFAPQTIKPTSFDPLNADQANNLMVMRMINLTPLEVAVTNRLTSQILLSFSYEPEKKLITFVVRNDRHFSDGSLITSDDVAFAIARMAFTRPKFPVISEIEGLNKWRETKDALNKYPEGITVEDSVVRITLTRNVDNPLFRFVLEIFSIIPKKAVKLVTNKLLNSNPHSSGNYLIHSQFEDRIVFNQRLSPLSTHHIEAPKQITFEYFKSDPDFSHFMDYPGNMVFSGLEFPLRAARVDLEKQGARVIWTPASSFAVVVLNPNMAPFDDVDCRRYFAKILREEAAFIFGDDIGIEPSLFPVVVPGYLNLHELTQEIATEKAIAKFDSARLKWTKYPIGHNDFYNTVIERTARRLNITLQTTSELSSPRDHEAAFYKKESCFFFARSGFWPLDPVGDIRMLFTPNMHEGMRIIWSDPRVTSQLDQIGLENDPIAIKTKMQALNRYFVDKSIWNVCVHFRRYFASPGQDTLREIPLAVQQPYPWQAFKID